MKSKAILLSLIFSIFFLRCNRSQSLEKDGGIRIILKIDYSVFCQSVGFTEKEQQLVQIKVLGEIKNMPVKDFAGFINAYQKAEEKLFPETSLASIFGSLLMLNKINYNSTNEEVTQALKEEWDTTLLSTTKIIKKRLDQIDAENATIKTENGNNIIVEIPGIKNPKRIQPVLLTVGKLGFWNTYDNTDFFSFLIRVNDYLVKIKYIPKAHDNSISERPKNDTTHLNAAIASLLKAQNKQNAGSGFPLFFILKPLISDDGTLIPGSVIGNVGSKDTAEVKRIFQNDTISRLLPRDSKLLWSLPVQKNEMTYFELVAVKVDRTGGPYLDGSAITKAEPQQTKNGNEVSLQMDSEGTRIWRQMTLYNIDRQIAISIDNVVYDHPLFHNRIENGKSSITGNFTGDEVKDLASILNSGMYPVKLDLVKTEIIEAKK